MRRSANHGRGPTDPELPGPLHRGSPGEDGGGLPRARTVVAPVSIAVLCLLLLLSAVLDRPLKAQSSEDFLFERPALHLDLFGGLGMPRARSDVFDQTFDELFLTRGDLCSGVFGGSVGWAVGERLDVAAELAYARASQETEYRDYVGTDDLPIVQTVSLRRVPLSLILRGYLWDRGRPVGELAWVPASWAPYAGVGVGVTWYDLVREGEFVDEASPALDIYRDRLTWSGSTPTAQALAGAEFTLRPHVVLRVEGRYSWASGDASSRDFVGFEPMDLDAFRAVVGITIR